MMCASGREKEDDKLAVALMVVLGASSLQEEQILLM